MFLTSSGLTTWRFRRSYTIRNCMYTHDTYMHHIVSRDVIYSNNTSHMYIEHQERVHVIYMWYKILSRLYICYWVYVNHMRGWCCCNMHTHTHARTHARTHTHTHKHTHCAIHVHRYLLIDNCVILTSVNNKQLAINYFTKSQLGYKGI